MKESDSAHEEMMKLKQTLDNWEPERLEKSDKSTQKAYNRLRETLGLSENVDLWMVLSTASTRINRLQDQLDGTYDPSQSRFAL
jgi:hypothetical protein